MQPGTGKLRRGLSALLMLTLVAVLLAPLAYGQSVSGDLIGTVADQQGAVVPNAKVSATNVDTALTQVTTTNGAGSYRFANLPVGRYDITVVATNFKTASLKAYPIDLNKTATGNVMLAPGEVSTVVEVTSEAAVLDASTPQLQNTYEIRQMQNLPLVGVGPSGSGILNLSLLSAGVASSGGLGAGTGPAVSGQRPRNNNFSIEGVDNNNRTVTGPLVSIPNDAVENLTILQNQFSPEFGHSTGAQFNTVVLSGTNKLHGRVYEYFQNRNLNAIDVRNSSLKENPRLDRNRVGGQLGGPIIKNKLFFFSNYEYSPLGQASNPGALTAPTAAGLAAINSAPGLSATNKAIFSKYVPVANGNFVKNATVAGVTVPLGELTINSPNYVNSYFSTNSVDLNLSSADQIRGRYIYDKTDGINAVADFPQFYTPLPNRFHLLAVNEYHSFSPVLQNEFRFGFNRFAQFVPAGSLSYPGLDSFPNIEIDELGINIGPDLNAPQRTIQNTYQLVDNLSWTKGAHQWKFGYDGRRVISPQQFTQRSRGDYEYKNLDTYLRDLSPETFAERSLGDPTYYGNEWDTAFFSNDVWRFRPNLSLNLGVRYEYNTPTLGEKQQVLNQAATVPGLIDFRSPKGQTNKWQPRVGFAWSPSASANTSVRGGFAMAYDVFYDNIGILSLPPQLTGTIDPDISTPVPNFLANGGIRPASSGIRTFPTLVAQKAATSTHVPVDRKYPYSLTWNLGVQHSFRKSYTAEVRYVGTRGIHLNVQERINVQSPLAASGKSLPTFLSAPTQAELDALSVTLSSLRPDNSVSGQGSRYVPAYVAAGFGGTSAQFCATEGLPANCGGNFPFITTFRPYGSSIYHGLQSQLNRRFTDGLQLQLAYTLSHAIDDSTADFFSTVLSPRRMQDFQSLKNDRGSSALDRRHRFTATVLYEPTWFKNGNWLARNLLGNWLLAPIYYFESP